MKKFVYLSSLLVIVILASAPKAEAACATKIKDGTLLDSNGIPLTLGFDQFGYNYQALMFNGKYSTVDRVDDGLYFGQSGDFVDDSLIQKWSIEWLSNMDCNGDGKLDRGYDPKTGAITGISMGWLTNQVEGDYIGVDGDSHHYTYFAKIVYVGPAPAGVDPWAGKRIWGDYAIVEEVYNDPFGGYHGVDRSRLTNPGLGRYR